MNAATNSTADYAAEWALKRAKLADYLGQHKLDAVLLWHRPNFAWATGGRDNHIPNNSPAGVAGILATPDKLVCLCNNIEAPRMRDEELTGLDIEVVDYPWHDSEAARRVAQELFAGRAVAADEDTVGAGVKPLPSDFAMLRWQLTPQEADRYREGANRAAGAVEAACETIEPGMTEQEIAGTLDHCIRNAGLVPVVTLVSVDQRVSQFRHPIPTDKPMERYAMLVSCGVYGGLISNLTRFVHFGEIPEDLAKKQQAVADVDTIVNLATRPGRTLGDIFTDLQAAYAAVGHPDQWRLHHQGGSTGYSGRDVFATPGEMTQVLENQAFAWNPSITGAKSEDTVLITDDGLEILTAHSEGWPTIMGRSDEGELPRAACLVR